MKRGLKVSFFSSKLRWGVFFTVTVLIFFILWPRLYPQEASVAAVIRLEKLPVGLALVGKSPMGVEVKIRGVKSKIDSVLKPPNIVCGLDLSGIQEGMNTVPVKGEFFPFPKGVSIVEIRPSALVLRADKEIKRSIPIKLVFSGKPAAGYRIADASVGPAEAILRGPESILASIDAIKTKPIDLAGARDPIKNEVTLDLPDNVEVMFPKDRINSAIFIEENIIVKEIQDIPVKGNNGGYAFAITPPAIHLKIKGPENTVEKLSSTGDFEVFLDLKDLKPGVYARHATIRLPVNVTLVGVEPEIFTVKLSKEQGVAKDAAGP